MSESKGQNIKIIINAREYPLVASSPEMERMMRLAAEDINAKFIKYSTLSPKADAEAKMAFVAENEAVRALTNIKLVDSYKREVEALDKELSTYLEKIEKSR